MKRNAFKVLFVNTKFLTTFIDLQENPIQEIEFDGQIDNKINMLHFTHTRTHTHTHTHTLKHGPWMLLKHTTQAMAARATATATAAGTRPWIRWSRGVEEGDV